jgi:hypothetical protein
MNNTTLEHLKNLYANPVVAWHDIDKTWYRNKWLIVKENLSFFLVINPVLFFLINLLQFESFKKLFLRGVFFPLFFTGLLVLFLIVVCLLVEEIYRLTSFRDPGQNIFKLFVFSSLPFFSFFGFLDIPLFGKIIFSTGLVYSGYLLKTGIDKFLWQNKSSRRRVFLISSLTVTLTLIIFAGIIFTVTRIVSMSISKLFN